MPVIDLVELLLLGVRALIEKIHISRAELLSTARLNARRQRDCALQTMLCKSLLSRSKATARLGAPAPPHPRRRHARSSHLCSAGNSACSCAHEDRSRHSASAQRHGAPSSAARACGTERKELDEQKLSRAGCCVGGRRRGRAERADVKQETRAGGEVGRGRRARRSGEGATATATSPADEGASAGSVRLLEHVSEKLLVSLARRLQRGAHQKTTQRRAKA